MSADLEPVSPEKARDLHLESMKDDAAEWTRTSHKSHLRAFLEWCEEEGEIDDMNDLTGRHLYEFRIWRRDGGYSRGQNDQLAPKTLDSALTTIRSFLRFCAQIEAVPTDLYEKVPLPDLSRDDEVSDSTIEPKRVPDIMNWLNRYEYAGRDHVIWTLVWHTGARVSGIRALDLEDCDLESNRPGISFVHRGPETPLKNSKQGERFNRVEDHVVQVLQDYIDGPRVELEDEHGRRPLLTTQKGRASSSAVRDAFYRWTRPCMLNQGCPHGRDESDCSALSLDRASSCPSARSPHDLRKARVTKYRNDGVPRGAVADRLDTSEGILDKHYDRASKREQADRRWDYFEGR